MYQGSFTKKMKIYKNKLTAHVHFFLVNLHCFLSESKVLVDFVPEKKCTWALSHMGQNGRVPEIRAATAAAEASFTYTYNIVCIYIYIVCMCVCVRVWVWGGGVCLSVCLSVCVYICVCTERKRERERERENLGTSGSGGHDVLCKSPPNKRHSVALLEFVHVGAHARHQA
jgi:hypothetical protein